MVVGSANVDLVVTCPRLPAPGETLLGTALTTVQGGKGANQAIAAARGGAACCLIAAVGEDAHGKLLREALAEAGVDISRVQQCELPTGTAIIEVDAAGRNSIVVVPGANGVLALADDDDTAIAGAAVLLAQLEVPVETVTAAARTARAHGVSVVLNASPAAVLPQALLENVNVLLVNEGEAALLAETEPDDIDAAVERLLQIVPAVAVTLGAEGVRYADASGIRLAISPPPADAVDTTGAGDTFAGNLAAALAIGVPVDVALRCACAAASLAVRRLGAGPSIPDRDETDALCAEHYGKERV